MDEQNEEHGIDNLGEILSRFPREVRVFEHGIPPNIVEEFRKMTQEYIDDVRNDRASPTDILTDLPRLRAMLAKSHNPDEFGDEDFAELTLGIKKLFVQISMLGLVEVYRLLEGLESNFPRLFKDWIHAAQMQCRVQIENQLMDEPVGFIATALGGRDNKIRYYFAVSSLQPLDAGRARFLTQEYESHAAEFGVEIEDAEVGEKYVLYRVLVPYDAMISDFIGTGIDHCDFMHTEFLVTNLHKPSEEDLTAWANEKENRPNENSDTE